MARPTKLSIIVLSGSYERVHYALATAAAAAAIDLPVTLFFTMDAIHGLEKPNAGAPGWWALTGAKERDRLYQASGIAGFEELLESCVALGARVLVCEMGLRAIGIERARLRTDLSIEDGGLVTFLNDAEADGAMLLA